MRRQHLEHFFKIFDHFLDGVLIINDQKEVLYFNAVAQGLFKLRLKSVLGKKSYDHFIFNHGELFCMPNGTLGQDEASQYFEVDFTSSKQARGKVQIMVQPIHMSPLPPMWLIYFHNVADEINLTNAFKNEAQEKEKAKEIIFKIQDHLNEFSQMALKDEMTGLGNFRFFEREVMNRLNNSLSDHTPLGLVMMDVDKFKVFNDTYGHQQGDEVLKQVAKALNQSVRQSDVIARYGGEEFVMILQNCHLSSLEIVCEKVRKAVEEVQVPYLKKPGEMLWVTISLGGISIDPDEVIKSGISHYAPLLEVADQNLYQAKHSGRNRAIVSTWKRI
jgi:diguanylate cyclase (GGDEF)-like protein